MLCWSLQCSISHSLFFCEKLAVPFSVCFLPIWLLSEGFPVHHPASTVWAKKMTPRKNVFPENCGTHFDSLFNASERDYYEWVVLTILTRWMVMYCLSSHYFSLPPRRRPPLSLSYPESERERERGGDFSFVAVLPPAPSPRLTPLIKSGGGENVQLQFGGIEKDCRKNVIIIFIHFIHFCVSSGSSLEKIQMRPNSENFRLAKCFTWLSIEYEEYKVYIVEYKGWATWVILRWNLLFAKVTIYTVVSKKEL
jgi:hypothetical protein